MKGDGSILNIYKLQNGIIKSGLIRINRTVPILLVLACSMQVCPAELVSKRISDYSVIEDRNIFAPPRAPSPVTPPETPVVEVKPPPPKEVTAKKVTEAEGMLLTGIVFFDNKFHALLEDKATSKGAILSIGEVINGVSIIDIEEGKVILQSKGEKLEMALERESKETGFPPIGMGGPVDFGRGRALPDTRRRRGESRTTTPATPTYPPAYPAPYPYQGMPPEGMPPGMMLPEEAQ